MLLLFFTPLLLANHVGQCTGQIVSCNAEWCDPGFQPYPNIVAVLTGYNIIKGNPFMSGATHDPGFATGYIFHPTTKVEQNYTLHSGFTVQEIKRCNLTLHTEVVSTLQGYRDRIGKHLSSGKTLTSSVEMDTTMGARTAITGRYSRSEYRNSTDNAITECNSERLNANAGGVGVGQTSQKCEQVAITANDDNVEGFTREYITSYGSTPANNQVKWSQQEFNAPLPIKMELSPIVNLFTKSHFDPYPGLDYKSILKWFGPLYYRYCEDNKDKLHVKSCKVAKNKCGYDDTCVTRTQLCNNKPAGGYHCCPSCQNGGTCTEQDGRCNCTCKCARGWQGSKCARKYIDKDILHGEIVNHMRMNAGKNNNEYSTLLLNYLKSLYQLRYFFTVISYTPCAEFDNYAVFGGSYVTVFGRYNRNVALGWSRKNARFPSSSRMNQIQNRVVSAVKYKGRAWTAPSYGYPIAMLFVMRWGSEFRSHWWANTRLSTIFCPERSCSHESWGVLSLCLEVLNHYCYQPIY